MSQVAWVMSSSETNPCCCDNCNAIEGDLAFSFSVISPCPGASLAGFISSGTLTNIGGGTWTASIGTAFFDNGMTILSGNGTLTVTCDPVTGGVFAGTAYDNDLVGYSSFSSGGSPVPTFDPISNTQACAPFELGFGGALTLSLP